MINRNKSIIVKNKIKNWLKNLKVKIRELRAWRKNKCGLEKENLSYYRKSRIINNNCDLENFSYSIYLSINFVLNITP
jgi:hypothetical protein